MSTHPMFCDYCTFVNDAWWQYYHNTNYAVWQENVDRLIAAMRKRIAAQKQREADAAEEKQCASMPVLHVNDVWDDGGHYDFAHDAMMQWDDAGHYDAFMLDI